MFCLCVARLRIPNSAPFISFPRTVLLAFRSLLRSGDYFISFLPLMKRLMPIKKVIFFTAFERVKKRQIYERHVSKEKSPNNVSYVLLQPERRSKNPLDPLTDLSRALRCGRRPVKHLVRDGVRIHTMNFRVCLSATSFPRQADWVVLSPSFPHSDRVASPRSAKARVSS